MFLGERHGGRSYIMRASNKISSATKPHYRPTRYTTTAATVDESPIAASNGMSLRRARMSMNTAPPVAWKNDPCGSESITVDPAWIIAAPPSAATPASASAGENVWDAIVAPAVVDAVAPAISTPDTGARR